MSQAVLELLQNGPGLWIWLVAGGSLLLVLLLALTKREDRAQERIAALSSAGAYHGPVTDYGAAADDHAASMWGRRERAAAKSLEDDEGDEESSRLDLRKRLIQSGIYSRSAAAVFLLMRVALLVVPLGLGLLAGTLGLMPPIIGILLGVLAGLGGTIAPSFWLDYVKRQRQTKIRRALPDALDVIGVCLEGGLSLSGSLVRVAKELGTAHPMLAAELTIVERETQMGRTTGEALRQFANRFDLEELRSLASVITQAERFGSSVTRALQVYAETLRLKRHQRAEELAHKAAIKILFPTLFCIFPGIFIVILGPAAIQIYKTLIVGAALR